MAIKSRNISASPWLKLLAVMLAVSGLLLACYGTLELPNFQYAVQPQAFGDSEAKADALRDIYGSVDTVARVYRNEEFVTSGASSAADLSNYQSQMQHEQNNQLVNINSSYAAMIDSATQMRQANEAARLTAERDSLVANQQEYAAEALAENRAQLINQHLSNYQAMMAKLTEPNAYPYHAVVSGAGSLSNIGNVADVAAYFAELPAAAGGKLADGSVVYVGISPEKYAALEAKFLENRAAGMAGIYQVLAGLILFLLGFGYVLYSAGNQPGTNEISLGTIDRLYLDIGLGLLVGAVIIPVMLGIAPFWYTIVYRTPSQMPLVISAVLITIGALLAIAYGSMVAKRVKRGEFLRHTLIYVVLAGCVRMIRRFWRETVKPALQSGPVAVRIGGLLALYALAVLLSAALVATSSSRNPVAALAGLSILFAVNAYALLFLLRKATVLRQISNGAERVKNGDLSYRIPLDSNHELATLAQNINNIAAGLKAAVDSEVKAERLKAELITNVSHDLKTPLTSLITYIDLLKTEGLTSAGAPRYLEVLDQKSQRLRILTDDLFEAAKAASGSLSLNREKLDAGSLLTQGLGELSDRVAESGLDFRVNIPTEKLYVLADGKLLWRVIENLLSNIFKYALPGSRVYAEVGTQGDQVAMVFKNISAAPLNMEADELLERFKRGDESRHSEGSGLGLAIAKSLVELQGGHFKVEVDGDLFKATVTLPHCT